MWGQGLKQANISQKQANNSLKQANISQSKQAKFLIAMDSSIKQTDFDLFNNEQLESDNNGCYEALRSSKQLWNAIDFVFGSFHQNDVRFSEQSRGYQCTCIALCMLSYAHCLDVNNSLILDKVLCEGDALYQNVISKLKTDGKFVQHRC